MRLLPWLLLPAISVVTALSISGIEINVLAEVGSGSIEAFELFGTSGIDLTDTTLTDAATLILQDGTGYLYVEDNEDEAFTSGYAILVVPFNVVNVYVSKHTTSPPPGLLILGETTTFYLI